ncbi:MAG: hypothetical protein U0R26_11415, partial [Solirubrobacterales bacterium]
MADAGYVVIGVEVFDSVTVEEPDTFAADDLDWAPVEGPVRGTQQLAAAGEELSLPSSGARHRSSPGLFGQQLQLGRVFGCGDGGQAGE